MARSSSGFFVTNDVRPARFPLRKVGEMASHSLPLGSIFDA
jgi:hypothetical protein